MNAFVSLGLALGTRTSASHLKNCVKGILFFSVCAQNVLPVHPELPPGTRFWMCHRGTSELSDLPSWRSLNRYVDNIHLYIDLLNTARLGELRDLAELLNRGNIEVSVELAGLANWHADKLDAFGRSQTAERSYENEYAKLAVWLTPVDQGGAGGRIDHLCFDGAFRRCLYPDGPSAGNPGFHTIESTAREFVEVMELWKSGQDGQNIALPDVSFRLYENFPHWGYIHSDGTLYPAYQQWPATGMGILGQGDMGAVIDAVIAAQDGKDVSLKGILIDHPYDYYIKRQSSNHPSVIANVDFKQRLLDLESFVEERELEFGLTFNSLLGGNRSNKQFNDETLAYIEEHLASGSTPKIINVQSWYAFPEAYLPESQPYTLAYTARKAMSIAWPDRLDAWYFEDDNNSEGWIAVSGTTSPVISGGHISGVANGLEINLLREGLMLNANHLSAYEVDMAVSQNCRVGLSWTTTSESLFIKENQVVLAYTGNGLSQTLVFPLTGAEDEDKQMITALRLEIATEEGASFQVEQVLPVYTSPAQLLDPVVFVHEEGIDGPICSIKFDACRGFGYRLLSQNTITGQGWQLEMDTGMAGDNQEISFSKDLTSQSLFFAIEKYRP